MSTLLQLLGIAGVAAGLLWGCGLLAGRALLPRRHLPLLPLAAPFLGFSLISAVGHYAGAAGLSLRSVLWLPVGLAAAGWAVALLGRRLPRSSAPVLGICVLSFLFAVGPILSLGYLTTIGETIDGVSYAVRSEYLQTGPLRLPEIQPGKPYLGWVRLQLDLLRAGDVYFVGLLGLLTGRRSYELLTVVPALFFALTAASAYVLARIGFGLRRLAALTAAGLLAVHNFLLWPVYDNFLSQTIALSLLPLVLAFGVEGARRPGWRMAALFALAMSGLVSVYPAFALRALAAVLLFWGLTYIRRPRAMGRAVLWWLGVVGLAVLWNGVALKRSAAELGLLSGALSSTSHAVGTGNVHVFPPVMEVFGVISHAAAIHLSRWERVPMPVLNALGLAFAGFAAYGWWRLKPRGRLAAAALLATGLLLAAQQRWGAQYPYGYFKALTTVVAEVMLLVAAGLAALWSSRRPGVKWLALGAALLLLAVNVKHSLWSQSYVLGTSVFLDRELIGIGRAVSEVEPDAWVLIDLRTGLRQNWLGYLIRDRKIRYREPLRVGDVDNPGAEDAFFRYAVVETELDGLRRRTTFDEPWYDPGSYSRLGGNARYELRDRKDPVLAGVRLERRWPEGSDLAVGFDGNLSVQLGTESREGQAGPGQPRTVQLRLYSLTPSSRVEVAGLPVDLPPGGWLLDVDLGCVAGRRLGIGRAGGDVILSDVRSLRTVTGKPGACLETVPLPTGVAYVEQDDLGLGRVRLRSALLRPEGAGERRYRLAYHVIELNRGAPFGVWSLDFPRHPRVQHGSLEIDLRDRSARGEIDGRPAGLTFSHPQLDTGFFEADMVWWQFEPHDQLQVYSMLWFRREEEKVWLTAVVPRARLEILSGQ